MQRYLTLLHLGSLHDLIAILNNSLLFTQFIVPKTTTNWPLIGGLAGTGVVLAVVIIIVNICVFRKRRENQQLDFAAREKELEMNNRGKAVAGGSKLLVCYKTSQCI